MQVAFDAAEQDQAVLGVVADGDAGVGQRSADDARRERIVFVAGRFAVEQQRDPAVQGVELLVARLGKLGGEFAQDDVLAEHGIVHQRQPGGVRESLRVVAVAAGVSAGDLAEGAAEMFDVLRPAALDVGAQVEVAGLQQAVAGRVGEHEEFFADGRREGAQPQAEPIEQQVAAFAEQALPRAAAVGQGVERDDLEVHVRLRAGAAAEKPEARREPSMPCVRRRGG